MHLLASLAALLAVTGPALTATGPAPADVWSSLQEATGSTLAVALDGGSTALISVTGPDEATIVDQRRAADGTLGVATEVMTVEDAEACRPVDAAAAIGNVAVAVECRLKTDDEEPPSMLAELVWTADGGWVWRVQADAVLGSVDYSPAGQYAVFATDSEYGGAHHVTSYHADLGWRDLTRRERGLTIGDIVAAIDDSGDVVAIRGAGMEDEPGYWFGGRLRVETYDAAARTWTRRLTRSYPDGGIDPKGVDVAGGRFSATLVESRSTGKLDGRDSRVVLLAGRPGKPRSWTSPRWGRLVVTATAAITGDGVGAASWQAVGQGGTVRSRFATWTPGRERPSVHALPGRTTLTDATVSGDTMDLAVSADGRGVIAWVRHRRGADQASVAGASFRIGSDGQVGDQVDATWWQPVGASVAVTTSGTSSAVTLGRLIAEFYPAPETRFSVIARG
ncbi:hypothetical protein AAII07_38080 [Microvirga sp. 0TCS3.31]